MHLLDESFRQRITESQRRLPPQRPRLLIVEDEPQTLMLMRYILRDTYHTEGATSVADALKMALEKNYDGFLLDIGLPDGSGVEVIEGVRAQAQYRHVPAAAVTAYAMPGDRERFLSAGFDAYISKPFKKQDLFDTLHTLFRRVLSPVRLSRAANG